MDTGAPISYAVLEPGTAVYSSDEQQIGAVTHVLAAVEQDIFDGIVIGEFVHGPGHRFVDAPEIDRIYERAVLLTLDGTACRDLPEPSANPAVMRDDPADDTSETRAAIEAKLQQAWNIISGKY